MIQLQLPKEHSKKYINHTPWVLLTPAFFPGIFFIERNKKCISWEFLKSFDFFNMIAIFMISAKFASPIFLEIKVFWSKGYDAIISISDITSKVLPSDLNYIANVLMWPEFGNSNGSMTKIIVTLILWRFDQKNWLFWGVVMVQVQWFRAGPRYALKILPWYGKRIQTKSQRVSRTNF